MQFNQSQILHSIYREVIAFLTSRVCLGLPHYLCNEVSWPEILISLKYFLFLLTLYLGLSFHSLFKTITQIYLYIFYCFVSLLIGVCPIFKHNICFNWHKIFFYIKRVLILKGHYLCLLLHSKLRQVYQQGRLCSNCQFRRNAYILMDIQLTG
jgi:hypothetical protein